MRDSSQDDPAAELIRAWGDYYRPTRLLDLPELARRAGVARVLVKVEAERPLGSFKALGGTLAALRALARVAEGAAPRLICASAGNHGLAVAAAAHAAGAKASIFLAAGVSRRRAERLQADGADIVRVPGTYDDAVRLAAAAAAGGEGILIPDTSTDPVDPVVKDVMAGYGLLARELVQQLSHERRLRPSHVFVQAGVGGLAAAMACGLRQILQSPGQLLVVEPQAAPCVALALEAGHPVSVPGDLRTCAEMLSCGLASAPALEVLLRHAVASVLVGEEALASAVCVLEQSGGPQTTPSGAAGLAGFLHVAASGGLRTHHQLTPQSIVLLIATEGRSALLDGSGPAARLP
jgi:diaminopropionate ammonia-lyase